MTMAHGLHKPNGVPHLVKRYGGRPSAQQRRGKHDEWPSGHRSVVRGARMSTMLITHAWLPVCSHKDRRSDPAQLWQMLSSANASATAACTQRCARTSSGGAGHARRMQGDRYLLIGRVPAPCAEGVAHQVVARGRSVRLHVHRHDTRWLCALPFNVSPDLSAAWRGARGLERPRGQPRHGRNAIPAVICEPVPACFKRGVTQHACRRHGTSRLKLDNLSPHLNA